VANAKEGVLDWAERVLKANVDYAAFAAKQDEAKARYEAVKERLKGVNEAEEKDPVMVEVLTKKLGMARLDLVRQITLQYTAEERRKKAIEAFRRADATANGTHYGSV